MTRTRLRHAVAVIDLGSLDAALEYDDLLAKGEVVEDEAGSLRDHCIHQLEEQVIQGMAVS